MDPQVYVPAYLERLYLASHPDLTPAARSLVHDDVLRRPEKYATSGHAQALLAYAKTHARLMTELARLEDLPDEEFERSRNRLFGETRLALCKIAETDRLCVDAALVATLLADVPVDDCINDLLKLESGVREHLTGAATGFDADAPHFWGEEALAAQGATAAELTAGDPVLIGWLHTLEAISQLCLATARYRAAIEYARLVMRAAGYPNHAEGTVLLALARLEDEDGFFSFARDLEQRADGAPDALALDDSPWYLLARTLLLYKIGRRKAARRALRDFATRCDGGAFFLLNPTYLTPYLPVRPAPTEPWGYAHQAVWEADGIIADTPDFVAWAESVDGVFASSEAFADRNGF